MVERMDGGRALEKIGGFAGSESAASLQRGGITQEARIFQNNTETLPLIFINFKGFLPTLC
jgi:hypothetical protein